MTMMPRGLAAEILEELADGRLHSTYQNPSFKVGAAMGRGASIGDSRSRSRFVEGWDAAASWLYASQESVVPTEALTAIVAGSTEVVTEMARCMDFGSASDYSDEDLGFAVFFALYKSGSRGDLGALLKGWESEVGTYAIWAPCSAAYLPALSPVFRG